MPSIYFYKLTVDDGGAPCVEKGLLSLAICKPMIRSSAQIGDIIVGFAANSLHSDNRLIYIAEVTDKLCGGDYFKLSKYARRSDCIYEWRGGKFAARPKAKYHGNHGDLVHDLGKPTSYARANTLLSRKFCYFGSNGSVDYKNAFPAVSNRLAELKQGHRVHHTASLLSQLDQLVSESCSLDSPCVLGEPSGKPKRGVSHRGGGCGVAEGKRNC